MDMEDTRNLPVFESLNNLEAFLISQKKDFKKDKILIAVDEFYMSNTVIKIFKLDGVRCRGCVAVGHTTLKKLVSIFPGSRLVYKGECV